MRVLRRTPGARRRRRRARILRIPRAAVVLLACLPGLAAVLVLALCANGIGHHATTAVRRPVAARPAALQHGAPKSHPVTAPLLAVNTSRRYGASGRGAVSCVPVG
ncbi:hypothetical protein AB0I50_45580, partial [Streptomyces prunicolor]